MCPNRNLKALEPVIQPCLDVGILNAISGIKTMAGTSIQRVLVSSFNDNLEQRLEN